MNQNTTQVDARQLPIDTLAPRISPVTLQILKKAHQELVTAESLMPPGFTPMEAYQVDECAAHMYQALNRLAAVLSVLDGAGSIAYPQFAAEVATQDAGYWFCPACRRMLSRFELTFDERCHKDEHCGNLVEWVSGAVGGAA